jgi:uncharacterized membrane protein
MGLGVLTYFIARVNFKTVASLSIQIFHRFISTNKSLKNPTFNSSRISCKSLQAISQQKKLL